MIKRGVDSRAAPLFDYPSITTWVPTLVTP